MQREAPPPRWAPTELKQVVPCPPQPRVRGVTPEGREKNKELLQYDAESVILCSMVWCGKDESAHSANWLQD
ncbi:hypothetical protein NDU88_001013 [Pleurodeles waltl]|uniref:Uncharacterized protein n=1 Tax=Pleurodeles waltl TaxID=8319 RepID=A0AAV7TH51_PLEWA|nr:hypothetical protein NDU88_001013 [Pleurodeles waltl]